MDTNQTDFEHSFGRIALTIAAVLCFLIAVAQVILAFSVEWSRDFNAPEELLGHEWLLLMSGILMSAVFALFGLYGLSGAGHIRPLPYLRIVLVLIGLVFSVRALPVAIELVIESGANGYSTEELLSSGIAFVTGLAFLSGSLAHIIPNTRITSAFGLRAKSR